MIYNLHRWWVEGGGQYDYCVKPSEKCFILEFSSVLGLGLEPWWERGLGLGLGLYNTNYSLSETRPLSGHFFKKEFGSPRRIGYFSHVTFFCGAFKPVEMVQTLSRSSQYILEGFPESMQLYKS